MGSRKNPIQRRLGLIHDTWVEFAELPEARVLCLLVAPDELRMVEAFITVESDEQGGTLPDLFVQLLSPFDAASPYGFALCAEFAKIAECLHEGLESPETPKWVAPQYVRGEDDIALWVKTCASFSQHYALPGHFAAVLRPESVSDLGAYQMWIQRFAAQAPQNVRAVLVDAANAPALTPLVQVERVRVVAQPLDLDMAGARLEISQDAGGLDTPGGKFRHLFVKLSNALGEGKLPEALALGQSALGIAEDQQWFALAVPIHFSLGAALAGNGQVTRANQRYLQAELAAVEGEKAGDPVCTKLRAQARMARGGLLIGIQQYPAAAKLFIETRALASAAEDPRMVIDCCRLASFAFERSGRYEQAWRAGADGLGYAKDLDAETRQTSNLPYLGEGMMRLTKRSEYSTLSQRIEREMVALLGTKDWRPKAAPPPPGAVASASP